MRISDWSSDVCSSDLVVLLAVGRGVALLLLAAVDVQVFQPLGIVQRVAEGVGRLQPSLQVDADGVLVHQDRLHHQVGVELDLVQGMGIGGVRGAHEQDRKSVVEGKGVAGRVDLGGRGSIKKNKKK